MPNQVVEIKKFDGIYLQQNSFEVPDGAFEQGENASIQNDGRILKYPGWYSYYTTTALDPVLSLFSFQNKLIGCYGSSLAYFTDDTTLDTRSPVGVKSTLTGDSFTVEQISRSAQQNLNLYYTTKYGVFKLETYNGKVRRSGAPPGLDIYAKEGTAASGPLPADSQTSYRAVFGRRDENGNLILGAPSDITTVGVRAGGTGLSYTSSGAGPYTVTVTLTTNSGFYVGQQIVVTNASDTDANGTQTITALSGSTQIQYSVAANPASGTLDISFSRTALLWATLPTEIDSVTDEWFVQWYRTSSSSASTVEPSPDFAIVGEQAITQANITNRVVTFTDDVDPTLVGAELYTNPNSREGEQQANFRPPKSSDLALYNTYMMYANVITIPYVDLQLIDPVLTGTYYFKLKVGNTTEQFKAVSTASGVGNTLVNATSVSGTTTITITYNTHGASTGWTVYVTNITGTLTEGIYTVTVTGVNTFTITATAGQTATALSFEFVTNGTDAVFSMETTSGTISTQVAFTAQHLVKAINRVSSRWYGNYTSTFDDIPGKMRISYRSLTSTLASADYVFYVADTAAGGNFVPPLPSSFSSGTQVYSSENVIPDAIYYSKSSEPEAVPPVNFVRIGSKNKAIKRIFELRDCLVILKEDGAFILSGQSPQDFTVSTLDATVFFDSDTTASKINNAVMAISNQGLVQVTEKSVQIISRRMDDVIQPRLGNTAILQLSLGFGFETQRTYYLSFTQDDDTIDFPATTWLYNVLNNTWTQTDLLFKNMVIGPSGVGYGISPDSAAVIYRQRTTQTLVDYSREFRTATAQAASDSMSAAIVVSTGSTSFTPQAGDAIVYQNSVSHITSIVSNPAVVNGYTAYFDIPTNIPTNAADDVIIYQGYRSVIKFAPFHAGSVGQEKFFSEFQVHQRRNSISRLSIRFGGAYFGTSETTVWSVVDQVQVSSPGWGYAPWGLFPWGLPRSIFIQSGSGPGAIIRIWVPQYAARNTFLQVVLSHREACEQMSIQAIVYKVRGYGSRTSV